MVVDPCKDSKFSTPFLGYPSDTIDIQVVYNAKDKRYWVQL